MNEENKNLLKEIGKRFDEKTEEINKRFDDKTEEIKRHFDLTIEELESKIDLLAEGQGALRDKVDSLETKVDSLVEDMDYVKSNLVDKADRFKEVDEVVDNHEKRLIKLEKVALAQG